MRRLSQPVAFAVWACFLGLQLSGLHLHAGGDGFDATPHGAHVHGAGAHVHDVGAHVHDAGSVSAAADVSVNAKDDHDGGEERHDHGDYRDVAVFELAAGAAKLPPVLTGPALEILAAPPSTVAVRGTAAERPPSARAPTLRPPLRGPPPRHCV